VEAQLPAAAPDTLPSFNDQLGLLSLCAGLLLFLAEIRLAIGGMRSWPH
jgi:hypothetical protein